MIISTLMNMLSIKKLENMIIFSKDALKIYLQLMKKKTNSHVPYKMEYCAMLLTVSHSKPKRKMYLNLEMMTLINAASLKCLQKHSDNIYFFTFKRKVKTNHFYNQLFAERLNIHMKKILCTQHWIRASYPKGSIQMKKDIKI